MQWEKRKSANDVDDSINENKTKYIEKSTFSEYRGSLDVDDFSFETFNGFTYLELIINISNTRRNQLQNFKKE